uniref:Uncharacterized protein n=1 Tax=Caenorhabditis japonica TaxID=281687 RepID=A0A8R1IWY4_CAEJA
MLRAPVRSGCKNSDRIGSRCSSQNHIRRVADVSEISLLCDMSSVENTSLEELETLQIDSSSAESSDAMDQTSKENLTDSNLFVPLLSSTMLNESRRSGRKRKPRAAFSPSSNEQFFEEFN